MFTYLFCNLWNNINGDTMINKYNNYNKDFKKIICKNIKYYRKQKNIRLMDLAEMLDVSPEYLKRIESPNDDNKSCSLTLLYKLSIILDKKMDDFLIDNEKDKTK